MHAFTRVSFTAQLHAESWPRVTRGRGWESELMQSAHYFDDADIRRMLMGNDGDLAQAIGLIDRQLRDNLCGWLRKRCPMLDADALANVWSEMVLCVLKTIRAGRFDATRPLLPWLCRILYARAVDDARRQRSREEMLVRLAHALRQRGRSRMVAAVEDRREVVQLIEEAIATVPPQQRRVLQAFVDHYPASGAMERLRELVSRVTGRVETLASVKRALQEARVKVRRFLWRKGYCLGENGIP